MSKSKIKLCPKCKCLTEHIYKGKVDERTKAEKELDTFASIVSLGIYPAINALLDSPSKKYYECARCKYINIQ